MIALEGERNEKLSWHPSGKFRRCRLLAYKIHHHPVFYTLCLLDNLALMGLAVQEAPTTTNTPLTDELRAVRSTIACFVFFLVSPFNLALHARPALLKSPHAHTRPLHALVLYVQNGKCDASIKTLERFHAQDAFSILHIYSLQHQGKYWYIAHCNTTFNYIVLRAA